jgi:hypothetical protein
MTFKKIPTFILAFFVIDIILCIIHLPSNFFLDRFNLLARLTNLNNEFGLGSWYASIQHFVVFALSFIYVYQMVLIHKKNRPLILLPLVFLFFSIDETTQIHESIGGIAKNLLPITTMTETFFPVHGVWLIFVAIPFIVFITLFAFKFKDLFITNIKDYILLVKGIVVFLTGAVVIEYLQNFTPCSLSHFFIMVEEGFEMVGSTIMLWSMYNLSLPYTKDVLKKKPS